MVSRSGHFLCFVKLGFLALLGASPVVAASRVIEGPVSASLLKVIDGDTLLVDASPWPGHRIRTYVRLRGIDAPELRSKCPSVREAAHKARQALELLTKDVGDIALMRVSGDKYFGRVIADVLFADGRDAAQVLLSQGYAVEYDGGRKSPIQCGS